MRKVHVLRITHLATGELFYIKERTYHSDGANRDWVFEVIETNGRVKIISDSLGTLEGCSGNIKEIIRTKERFTLYWDDGSASSFDVLEIVV